MESGLAAFGIRLYPQLAAAVSCCDSGSVVSEKHRFPAVSTPPSSSIYSVSPAVYSDLLFGEKGHSTDVPLRTEPSTVSYSLHFDPPLVCFLIANFCKKKLP